MFSDHSLTYLILKTILKRKTWFIVIFNLTAKKILRFNFMWKENYKHQQHYPSINKPSTVKKEKTLPQYYGLCKHTLQWRNNFTPTTRFIRNTTALDYDRGPLRWQLLEIAVVNLADAGFPITFGQVYTTQDEAVNWKLTWRRANAGIEEQKMPFVDCGAYAKGDSGIERGENEGINEWTDTL